MYIAVLLLLCGGARASIGFGSCTLAPDCHGVEHVNRDFIQGSWFVAARDTVESVLEANSLCSLYNIKSDEEGLEFQRFDKWATFPRPSSSGKIPEANFGQHIVATDYLNYLVLSDCEDLFGGLMHRRSFTLLSRDAHVGDDYAAKVREEIDQCWLTDLDIWTNSWNWACNFDQQEVCPPQPDPLPAIDEPVKAVLMDNGMVRFSWESWSYCQTKTITKRVVEVRGNGDRFEQICKDTPIWENSCEQMYWDFYSTRYDLKSKQVLTRVWSQSHTRVQSNTSPLPTWGPTMTDKRSPVRHLKLKQLSPGKARLSWSYPAINREVWDRFWIQVSSQKDSVYLPYSSRDYTIDVSPGKVYTVTIANADQVKPEHYAPRTVQFRGGEPRGTIDPASVTGTKFNGYRYLNISWPESVSEEEPLGYRVQFFKQNDTAPIEIPECGGSEPQVMEQKSCNVAADYLSKLGLFDEYVTLRVLTLTKSGEFVSSPQTTLKPSFAPKKTLPLPQLVSIHKKDQSILSVQCQVPGGAKGITGYSFETSTDRDRTKTYYESQDGKSEIKLSRLDGDLKCAAETKDGKGPYVTLSSVYYSKFIPSINVINVNSTSISINYDPRDKVKGYDIKSWELELKDVSTRTTVFLDGKTYHGGSSVYSETFDNLKPDTEYQLLISPESYSLLFSVYLKTLPEA